MWRMAHSCGLRVPQTFCNLHDVIERTRNYSYGSIGVLKGGRVPSLGSLREVVDLVKSWSAACGGGHGWGSVTLRRGLIRFAL